MEASTTKVGGGVKGCTTTLMLYYVVFAFPHLARVLHSKATVKDALRIVLPGAMSCVCNDGAIKSWPKRKCLSGQLS